MNRLGSERTHSYSSSPIVIRSVHASEAHSQTKSASVAIATVRCAASPIRSLTSRKRLSFFAVRSSRDTEEECKSHLSATRECSPQRHLVRVLEIPADGEPAREACHSGAPAQPIGQICRGRLSRHVRVGRED